MTDWVKLIPLSFTWTCLKCTVQNVVKAYELAQGNKIVTCFNCGATARPGSMTHEAEASRATNKQADSEVINDR